MLPTLCEVLILVLVGELVLSLRDMQPSFVLTFSSPSEENVIVDDSHCCLRVALLCVCTTFCPCYGTQSVVVGSLDKTFH